MKIRRRLEPGESTRPSSRRSATTPRFAKLVLEEVGAAHAEEEARQTQAQKRSGQKGGTRGGGGPTPCTA